MAGSKSTGAKVRDLDASRKVAADGADSSADSSIDFEATARALSECADDALSQAACGGIIDPVEVVEWVKTAKRLVLYERDVDRLKLEVPKLAHALSGLLLQVDLPSGQSADQTTRLFMGKLVQVRDLLAMDVEAAYQGDPAARSFAEIALSYPSLLALAVYRIAHELHLLGVPLLPRIMTEYAHDRTGVDIHPGAQIGRYFFIDHATGVVIGETAEVGDHVRIYQGVTLGAASLRDGPSLRGKKRHPTIEDDVTIYAGATILGGDTLIGRGSVIGGNVWITESVPAGIRVVAEPARQMVRDGRDASPDQLKWDI